jgi:hypothetical protein
VKKALVGFMFALLGCGRGERRIVMSTSDPAEYPSVLHEPRTLPYDFMVRQTITINARHNNNTKPTKASFEAVVQKQGDTLLIVGFGPMNVKVFTITQQGNRIEFVQYMGPTFPFSPRNILVDVHRVFFKHLPPPEVGYSGVRRGELDGETVEETWKTGQLASIVFTRPTTSTLHGAIRVELGAGCGPSACEPASAKLHNEWFGYTLAIENQDFQRL